jgi:hypothetical protein
MGGKRFCAVEGYDCPIQEFTPDGMHHPPGGQPHRAQGPGTGPQTGPDPPAAPFPSDVPPPGDGPRHSPATPFDIEPE